MKTLAKLFFVTVVAVLFAFEGKASHVAGTDIQYQCVGQDSFLVTLNLFRDCSGITVGATQNLNFTSSCGGTVNAIANQVSVTEVSQLCPQQLVNSTCNGGLLPGMQHYIYQALVVLTPPCNSWTASWQQCCRNTSVNTSGGNMYVQTVMNTATNNCNNSPSFNAQPIPYVCAFQTVNYNFGVTEPDGDSVVYSLAPALISATGAVTYNFPYSVTSPIVGLTLNTQTGQLTFTPTTLGNFIIVVQVDEYDPVSGLLIGSTTRDIQVIVITCTNNQPLSTGATNFSGTGNLIDSNSIEVCYGQSFSFEVQFTDQDTIDSLQISSNITQILPGATFNITQNSPTAQAAVVNWIAQPGTPTFNVFNMAVSDGACPIPGILSITFDITVLPGVYAGEDTIICGNNTQSAQLQGVGAPTMTWSVVSGPPMVVGTGAGANFSCNPCDNPVATPSATTVYQLSGGGYNGPCDSLDTVTVFVAPDFTLQMPNDTVICDIDSVVLVSNATPFNTNIDWSWDNGTSLDDDTLLSPQAQPNVSTTYTLTATSNAGCIKSDTVRVTVPPPFPPNIQAVANDTILCLGQNTQFVADLGTVTPAQCGVAPNGCLGTVSQIIVGNGTVSNSTTGYPSILGNFFEAAKHQYLYTAADLNAAGFTGGAINGLAFFIVGTPNQTQFQNFEIKIGCANASGISAFQTGLTTVFPAQTVTATTGWNQFNFASTYDYDGVSDLIIDFCFNNGNIFMNNGNARIRYTTTTYPSAIHSFGSDPNLCNAPGTPISTTSRANIRFSVCSGADPLAYTYQWTPGSLLNNTTAQTPTWSPTAVGNYNYQVIIQDTFGVCADTTDTLPVEVVLTFDATITTESPYCVSGPLDTLAAATGGGSWSGPGITDTANGFFDPTTLVPGTYIVSYAIGGGCSSSDTASIVIAPPPNTNITTPGPFCVLDNSIQLAGVVPGGTWGGPNTTTAGIFNPSAAGVGTFNITYSIDSVCDATGTHPIQVIGGLNPAIGNNPDLCINALPASLNLDPSADPNGIWSGPGITSASLGTFDPNIAGLGSHTIFYTHPGGCGGSDSIIINVFALPTAEVTGILDDYCDNFTALVSPSGGTSGGTWSGFPGVNPNTGAFVPSSLNSANSPYTITYSVSDINNCTAIDNFTFDVFETPPPPSPVSTSQPYCEGETINDLQATVTGANTVQWYSDDQLTNLLTDGINYNAGAATSSFTLFLTQTAPDAQGGCVSDPLPLNIQVIPTPQPSFTATPSEGVAPLLVDFTNTTSPLGAYTYEWDFANGNISTLDSPNETFTEFGTYGVVLTATDGFGCVGTATRNVLVEVNVNATIPNIFTPNGDGENDFFFIEFLEGTNAVQSVEGKIFNRWGRKVAELNSIDAQWDGGNSEDGVYYYVVNIIAVDGTEYKLNGHVTLLRNPN